MNSNVTVSDDLKAMIAKCKPGQSMPMSVNCTVGKDGSATLSAGSDMAEEAPEKPAPAAPKKKAGSRPKPVMAALGMM